MVDCSESSPDPVRVASFRGDGASIFGQLAILGANFVHSRPTDSVDNEVEPSVTISASG